MESPSTTVEDMSTEELTSVYIKIRTAIQDKEEQHKQEIEELKEQLDVVANELLQICQDENADSIRTPAGTVSRRITTRYWTSDWDSMYQFIKEHDAPFLLEQRIHGSNMREFLENNPDALPAGLQADRKYTVVVRRPTKK
jgi:predicted secreted Zn-dependent protease